VVGVVVINSEGNISYNYNAINLIISYFVVGIPIKSTLDNATTIQYAGLISQLADKACSVVRELDPTNDLTFFRIRTKKHEIMVAPGEKPHIFTPSFSILIILFC